MAAGHLEHRVAVSGFVLEPVGERSGADVFEHRPEACRHRRAVDLEGARDPAKDGSRTVIPGGAIEAGLAEASEDGLHLARHVHLEHERFGRDARLAADLERDHDGCSQEWPERLLDEEVDGRLHGGAHLDGSRGQGAQGVGQS